LADAYARIQLITDKTNAADLQVAYLHFQFLLPDEKKSKKFIVVPQISSKSDKQ